MRNLKLAAAFLLSSNIVIGTLYLFLKCGGGSADRTALGTHASDSTALDKDTTEVKTPANVKGEEFTGEDEMYPEDTMIERMERRRANREDFDFDRRPPRGYRPGAPYPNDPMLNPSGGQRPNTPPQRPGQPQQRPGQPQQRSGQSHQRPGQPQQRPGQPQQRPGQTPQRPGQTPQRSDRGAGAGRAAGTGRVGAGCAAGAGQSQQRLGQPKSQLGDRPSGSLGGSSTSNSNSGGNVANAAMEAGKAKVAEGLNKALGK